MEHKVTVRETPCRTILNRSSISDYSLNCYTGCAHACVYCYARFMQRFHPHPEAWGEFVDVKVNAVEVLRRQLKRAKPGDVFMSSACDGWQPVEAERRLTQRCCRALLERGFRINILTKSALVIGDLPALTGGPGRVRVGVTVTTLDEKLRREWEPNCASVEDRWVVIARAKELGFETSVMFGPLLPFLSDGQASIDALFRRAAEAGVDSVWTDALNPRPKVWPAVAGLLERRYPGLKEAYRQVLFDDRTREGYLKALNERVASARRRYLRGGAAGT